MTSSSRTVLCSLAALLVPAVALAQNSASPTTPSIAPASVVFTRQPAPQPPAQPRPTGLPSRIKWTFNFDAGWGTFGFANSLFDNPKEPGVDEDLSDQWFEGYVKPAVGGDYTFSGGSQLYGKASVVGERTYGSVPAQFGEDVSSFGPE